MVEPCGKRAEEVAEEARSIGVSLGFDGGYDSAAREIAVQTRQLGKVYGLRETAVHALRDVTLSFPSREFAAVMGPSGSGKSTLMHCLAALDLPTSGSVFLGGTELAALSHRQRAHLRRDRIGFVFQAFNLIPTLDAYENITLPQLLAGRSADRGWLDRIVDQVGLGDRLHHRPAELSGGQQQRVAVARALAGRPEIIFADEPTGNLATRESHQVLALLRSAVDSYGQTLVMVTHDPIAAAHADRVVFLNDGQVVDDFYGPTADGVLERLKHLDGRPAGERWRTELSRLPPAFRSGNEDPLPVHHPEADQAAVHYPACLRRTSRRLRPLRSAWRAEVAPAPTPPPPPGDEDTQVQRRVRPEPERPETVARSDPDDGWLPALHGEQPSEAAAGPEPGRRDDLEPPPWERRRQEPPAEHGPELPGLDDATIPPPPAPATPRVDAGGRITAEQLLERIRARAAAPAKPSSSGDEDEDEPPPPAGRGADDHDSARPRREQRWI